MTFASQTFQADRGQPARRSGAANLAIGVVVAAAVIGLLLAGTTFMGLAIAFPIAVPVANSLHVAVRASDAALAQQLAGFWWVFAGLALASFVAAVVVAVKSVERFAPGPRD